MLFRSREEFRSPRYPSRVQILLCRAVSTFVYVQSDPGWQTPTSSYPNVVVQQLQTSDTSRLLNPAVANTVAQAPSAIPNITGLFESLVKAGLVSATSTPTGAGATAQVPDDTQTQPHDVQIPDESSEEATCAYRKTNLSEDVRLLSAEISR